MIWVKRVNSLLRSLQFFAGFAVSGGIFLGFALPGFAEPPAESRKSEVRIASPGEKDFVRGICAVKITASTDEKILQTTLSRDDAFLEADDSAPYEIAWDTRLERDGPHTLLARIQTVTGRWAASSIPVTVIVDNTPPRIHLTAPEPKTLVVGKTTLMAEATDNLQVAEVKFFVGNLMVGTATTPAYSLNWDPTSIPNGIHLLKAVAVDRAGNSSASNTIEVKVANPNRRPVLYPLGEAKRVPEGQLLKFVVKGYDPDGARDPLTYRAIGLPPWAQFDPKTGEFSGTPDFSVASLTEPEITYKVGFQVCDPEPLCSDPQELIITVLNVNRPPLLKPIQDYTIHEGEPLTITIPPAVDPDNDPLTYMAVHLPPWLKFDPVTLTFTGTPGFDVASTAEPTTVYPDVLIEVCDPEPSCAKAVFSITVLNTDRPPMLEPIGAKTLNEGKILSFSIRASDPDSDKLSLIADPLPRGAAFTDHGDGTGAFTWQTQLDQAGRYSIDFSAIQPEGGLKDTETVSITLREVSLSTSGTIRNSDGKPIPNVTVQIERGGKTERSVKTDTNGFYLIDGLSPDTYTVRPSYRTESAFSSEGRGPEGTRFDPISQPVTLKDSDQQGVDFTALPLE